MGEEVCPGMMVMEKGQPLMEKGVALSWDSNCMCIGWGGPLHLGRVGGCVMGDDACF